MTTKETHTTLNKPWAIIGAGSGWGARDMGTADGPKHLIDHLPDTFKHSSITSSNWHQSSLPSVTRNDHVYDMVSQLSKLTKNALLEGQMPLVFGGDHSIAIGTWSGVKAAVGNEDMALIWIDAHLDAHTPTTSPSLNMHGMPVAVLLGQGEARFTTLCNITPKLKAENVYLIGIRSFEEGEEQLLKLSGAHIYYMQEVQERGFHAVFEEVLSKLESLKFGLTIDVDAFDPKEAPGTGTPETGGLTFKEVQSSLYNLKQNPQFLGLEIAEFNSYLDHDTLTVNLVWNLVRTISGEQV